MLLSNARLIIMKWLTVVFFITFSMIFAKPEKITAQILTKSTVSFLKLNFKPPQRGAPGSRNDAGSRSSDLAFLPLIPKTNKGLTLSPHPTFWVYIFPNFACDKIGFTLLEKGGNTDKIFYQTQLKLSENKGLLEFSLPDNAPPLEIGESYRWIFSCGANARYGEIERIKLSEPLAYKINQINQEKKIEILSVNGIWYEVLTTLIHLRMKFPDDKNIKETWDSLLKDPAVELEELIPLFP